MRNRGSGADCLRGEGGEEAGGEEAMDAMACKPGYELHADGVSGYHHLDDD
jgi:hypothetical protein